MKKLTKIIGTLLTVVAMTACNSNYKEITVEEADTKWNEIITSQAEHGDKQVTVKSSSKSSATFKNHTSKTSGIKVLNSNKKEETLTVEDSEKLYKYKKQSLTAKIVAEDHFYDEDVTEVQEEWTYYKNGKLINATRDTKKIFGQTITTAHYTQETLDKQTAAKSIRFYVLGRPSVSSREYFALTTENMLYSLCDYGYKQDKINLKLYTNGGKESLKYKTTYNADISYLEVDIKNLTAEDVQNEITQSTNLACDLTVSAYNNWSANFNLTNVAKTKDNDKWIDLKYSETTKYKKGADINYPNLSTFKKVA